MATWGDQTCQRFEATAVGFETGFSRLRVRPSNRYAITLHPITVMMYLTEKSDQSQVMSPFARGVFCSGVSVQITITHA